MNEQKHILIDGLNLQRGGGVTVMDRLAAGFLRAEFQVTVLLSQDIALDPGTISLGLKVVVLDGAKGVVKSLKFRLFSLKPLTRTLAADAVLSFNYWTPSNLPQVTYHINVIPFLPFAQRRATVGLVRAIVHRGFSRMAMARSQLNLFESQHALDLARQGCKSIRNPDIAYIGVDQPVGKTRANTSNRHQIVSITSGASHKRNDLTLAAFRTYADTRPGAKLTIVGDKNAILAGMTAPDRAYAESSDQVSFTGYLDRAGLYGVLSESQALLTFSELESFFMVAIEAMSVGCPVVAPEISSIKESVGPAGRLFSPGNVDQAVAELSALDDDGRWAQLSAASLEWVTRFQADQCAAEFVQKTQAALFGNKG